MKEAIVSLSHRLRYRVKEIGRLSDMRVLLVILVLLLAIAPAVVALDTSKAQNPFGDVPKDHWSYKAVEQLQKHGYLSCYPENSICAPKPLTRYEFAVAIARVIPVMLSDGECAAKIAPRPEVKPQKPKADDVKVLEKLVNEYRDELAALGVDVDALKRDIDKTIPKPVTYGGELGGLKWVKSDQTAVSFRDSQNWPAGPPYARAVVSPKVYTKETPTPFSHVPKNHWSYKAVDQLQKDGYLVGYPENTFSGSRLMTRYEFAIAVARMIPTLSIGSVSSDKTTQKTEKEFQAAVTVIEKLANEYRDELAGLGVEAELIKREIDNAKSRPTADTNEIHRFRFEAVNTPNKDSEQAPTPFSDVPRGHWAYEAVRQLQEAGILKGYPEGKFEGNKPVTRNDFAVAIARILPMITSISESTNTTRQEVDNLERRISALERGEVAPKLAPAPPPADTPTKAEVESISNLISEFAVELKNMRVNIDAIRKDVDALKDRVTSAEKRTRVLE
jgi:archaellum component FlaC